MLKDDNSEVRELENRYPTSPSFFIEGLVVLGYIAAFLVLGAGAVGFGVIIAHFLIKAW